ncbi:MAG: ATP-binding protein, partial [Burkholderiaceae bacterium]
MRIAQLHLRAYGPFDGVVLDLDRPPAGLQIVYGPNEAGKSTAMRAIAALLFGFPTQTDDGHHRDYAALRVGGVLDDGHGARLAVMRRKGLRNTLCEFDPGTGEDLVGRALDQSAIDALLGGVDARRFASMHGLDAERLRQGGRSIAQGGGDLGAALFEAASGLPRLRAVIGSLTREADAIFVPRGQKPLLNAALSDHEQLRQAERAAGLRPRDWVQRRDALAGAEEAVSRAEAMLRAERERLARLERISALIPQVRRLAALRSASAALGDAPMLPPDAGERVAAWIHAQAESVQSLDAAARRLARDRAALAELKVSQPHRDAAAAIVQLAGRVEAHDAARASLPNLFAELRVASQGLDRALDEAGIPRDPGAGTPAEVALARLPTRARLDAMHAAVQDRRGLEHRRDDAAAALAEAARELDALRVDPDDEPAPVALESLAAALEAATAVGDLEARIAALQARLVTHEAGVARLAAALGGGDAESIARRVLPT